MVRIHPDPPTSHSDLFGAIAQLGERLLCKQEVTGSIPVGSTRFPRSAAQTVQVWMFCDAFRIGCLFFKNSEEVKRS